MRTGTGETYTGSKGSEFTTLRIHTTMFDRIADVDWNVLGQRVFVDPARSAITYMTPSLTHGAYSRAVDTVAAYLAKALGVVSAPLGDTRRRPPGENKNFDAEPDAFFWRIDRRSLCRGGLGRYLLRRSVCGKYTSRPCR